MPQLFNVLIDGVLRELKVRVLERGLELAKKIELWALLCLMYALSVNAAQSKLMINEKKGEGLRCKKRLRDLKSCVDLYLSMW